MNNASRIDRLVCVAGVGDAPDRPCRICADGTRNITVRFRMDGVALCHAAVLPCPGCGRCNVIIMNILDGAALRPGSYPIRGTKLGSPACRVTPVSAASNGMSRSTRPWRTLARLCENGTKRENVVRIEGQERFPPPPTCILCARARTIAGFS